MGTLLGSLRRLALAPSLASVTFSARGFPARPTPTTERLEAIPQSVVCGFEWAIESRTLWDVERRLELVDTELRGFAYEGATMALTVRDAIHGNRTRELLMGAGRPHLLLAYIGIGFAMARLPRNRWKKVIPDLSGVPYYPTMSWLAVDGYGFDRAYFDTRRWVDEQHVPAAYPWEGHPDYFLRAVDQGIGRALWFVHGADPDEVAAAVTRFAEHRRADLWAGVGLAATFAGGCPAADLVRLRDATSNHRADLAVGVVFAATARDVAGFVPEHTETATAALAEVSVADAVKIAARTGVDPDRTGKVLAYELWRQRIRTHFSATPARSK